MLSAQVAGDCAFLVAQMVKNLQCRRSGFNSWVGKILWRRKWLPTPIFFRGESHGQKNLAGYSPQGHKREVDMTKQLNKNKRVNDALERFLTSCAQCFTCTYSVLPGLLRSGHLLSPPGAVWGDYLPGTGKPGMLQSMGSQRAGHDLATRQQSSQIVTEGHN